MKVGLAYPAFFGAFKEKFKDSEVSVIKNTKQVEDYDLVVFTGGEDISPTIYGQKNLYSYGINLERDRIESNILTTAISKGKKIFGVCRGHQLINAICGARLSQDIYNELERDHPGHHPLEYIKRSFITNFFQEVNSLHHQGVIYCSGLTATTAYKGIVESSEGDNIITVQFHPEFMAGENVDNFFKYIEAWAMNSAPKRKEKNNISSITSTTANNTGYVYVELEEQLYPAENEEEIHPVPEEDLVPDIRNIVRQNHRR